MITGWNASRLFPSLGLAAAITTGVLASTSVANAQAGFAILHSFAGYPTDGALPHARLIQGPDGTLYGTTLDGGPGGCAIIGEAPGCGTVFQMAPDGSGYTVLHNFTGYPTDGQSVVAGLIQGPDGTLYGTTYWGGIGGPGACGNTDCGTVFRLAPDGSGYTILHTFIGYPTDGANPYAGLIQGSDGTLYGTTVNGGTGDYGTVFQIAPDGSSFTILHSFTGNPTDGAFPEAGPIQASDGMLYGTTRNGGTSNHGTVFQIAPDGSGFIILHSFTRDLTDGGTPFAGLIQGPDGTLYGTTYYGGTSTGDTCIDGCGTVFKMTPDGSGYTVLHSFIGDDTDGQYPEAGLIQGPDGTLYGTTDYAGTSAGGTVFQIAPDGSGYAILHSFTFGGMDGADPFAGLIQGPDGILSGTIIAGGSINLGCPMGFSYTCGTVFQLTLSPSAPKRR